MYFRGEMRYLATALRGRVFLKKKHLVIMVLVYRFVIPSLFVGVGKRGVFISKNAAHKRARPKREAQFRAPV